MDSLLPCRFAEDSDGFVIVDKPEETLAEPEVDYTPHSPRVCHLFRNLGHFLVEVWSKKSGIVSVSCATWFVFWINSACS